MFWCFIKCGPCTCPPHTTIYVLILAVLISLLLLVILDLIEMNFSVFDPLPGLSSSFPKYDSPDEARYLDQ
jgi:hypothetical protein